MTPEKENFEALRGLLRVKCNEQPPPGYFNNFSREVIARIRTEANTKHESLLDRLAWEAPWLRRLMETLQAKPALAMGLGAAVCAVLVVAVVYSENLEFKPTEQFTLIPRTEARPALAAPVIAPEVFGLRAPAEMAMAPAGTSNGLNSIMPVRGSLFDQLQPIEPVLTSGRALGQGQ